MSHVAERLPEDYRAHATAVGNVLIAVVPALFTVLVALAVFRYRWTAYDFHYSYYPAAHRLLTGANPYAVSPRDIREGIAFVYPALSAIAFVPLALLTRASADHVYMCFCLLLIPMTLWVMGVRDWRVYGPPLLCRPIIVGWQGGNVSVPLTCLVALAWKYRDRPLVAGFVTALAISLKPFVWPLALWLMATRRWRAAAWALLSGVILNLAAWAVVGFNQIGTYLRLSGQVTDALWRGGYSVLALAHHLGFGRGVGEALLVVGSIALIACTVYVGFVKRQAREAMVLSVALMLFASPLVWNHYYTLLLVPLALARPRFDPIWLLPTALWFCPPSTTATGQQVVLAWLVAGYCVLTALRSSPARQQLAHGPPESRPLTLAASGVE